MKLRRLAIRRMPGIDEPFALEDLPPGLVLVLGRNGSGKTTVCRAVRALLWPVTAAEFGATHATDVALDGEFVDGTALDGAPLHASLEHGRAAWQRDGIPVPAPDLPDARFAGCFGLAMRDLLLADGATEEALAAELRRRMAGGYDVAAVRERSFAAKRAFRREADDVRAREKALRDLSEERRALARAAERRGELEAALREAEAAAARARTLQTARQLLDERGLRADLLSRIAAMPAPREPMDALGGGEAKRVHELRRDRGAALEQERAAVSSLARAEAVLGASPLADGPIEAERVESWRERLAEIDDLRRRLDAARERLAAEQGRVAEAARRIDSGDAVVHRTGDEALARAASFLERADEARRALVEIDARLAVLEREAEDAGDVDPDDQFRAMTFLRDAHAALAREEPWPRGVLAAAATALLAALLSWRLRSDLALHAALLAGAGAGALAVIALERLGRARAIVRRCKAALADTGIAPPKSWTAPAIAERWRKLRRAWQANELAERQRERVAELEQRRVAWRSKRRELHAERAALQRTFGVLPGQAGDAAADLALTAFANGVLALRAAERECAAAGQAAALLERRLRACTDALVAELDAAFTPSGGTASGPVDPPALRATIACAERESHAARQAARDRERLLAERDKLRLLADAKQRESDALFMRLGIAPGDDVELARRMQALPAYRESAAALDAAESRIAALETQLAAHGDLRAATAEELDRAIAAASALADQVKDRFHELSRLDEEVKKAFASTDVEQAMDDVAAAKDELRRRRAELLRAEAGRFLLERVERDHERRVRPKVLGLAQELFGAFTQDRFALVFDAERDAFRARCTATGRGLALAELSDGTRVQLLLAARLAFALQVERDAGGNGAALPLLLDEVLATTDAERFDAIARALVAWIDRDGRQVVHLSANAGDVARWNRVLAELGREPVAPIDLDAVRRRARFASGAPPGETAPEPAPPEPRGLGAAAYARLVEAAPLDPFRPAGAAHLFHALRHDLALLHRALAARIETIGQWRSFVETRGPAALGFDDGEAHDIAAWCDVVEAFVRAWRVGRGRRVDRSALIEGGVSAAFIDRIDMLAQSVGGDAARLVRALERRESGHARGFRVERLHALVHHLEEHGHLDERPAAGADAILEEIARQASRSIPPPVLAQRVRELFVECAAAGTSQAALPPVHATQGERDVGLGA